MYIGSGDTAALLAAKSSKAHKQLLARFTSDTIPYYNAKASPIDALRTGAILEDRYLLTLPDSYYSQYEVYSRELSVLRATLDFARLDGGKVVDFDELKTCHFNDFLAFEGLKDADYNTYISYLKKSYRRYYNQVQQQLYCTELQEATLVFLAVYTYEDEENFQRDIQPNECIKFRIKRDESVINQLKERATPFQQLKDYYTA